MRRFAFLLLSLALASGVPIFAEVMDKEPTIAQNWAYAVGAGLLCLAMGRWRWWAGIAVSALWLAWIWGVRQELANVSVGPAILAEGGQRYVTQFYLSAVLGLALRGGAIYVNWRTRGPDNARRAGG
jgi:hypothetical protein